MRLPPTLWIKRGLIVLGVAGLLGALVWTLGPSPSWSMSRKSVEVPFVVTVDEEGKTRIKDVYTVSAPITGKLVRLSLEAGDRVKKDVTTVAIIEPMAPAFLDVRATRELEAQLEAAKAAVALAEAEINQAAAELEFAQSELRRAQSLIKIQDHFRAGPGAGAHRRRYPASVLDAGQSQSGRAQARTGERPGAADRPGGGLEGRGSGGMLRHRARTRERPGSAAHPGERAGGRGRDAIAGDRRPRQSRARCGVAVGRCGQGARGRHSDHRGLGRHAPIGESDPRRASRFHQGLGARDRRATGAHDPAATERRQQPTASSVTSSACS